MLLHARVEGLKPLFIIISFRYTKASALLIAAKQPTLSFPRKRVLTFIPLPRLRLERQLAGGEDCLSVESASSTGEACVKRAGN